MKYFGIVLCSTIFAMSFLLVPSYSNRLDIIACLLYQPLAQPSLSSFIVFHILIVFPFTYLAQTQIKLLDIFVLFEFGRWAV